MLEGLLEFVLTIIFSPFESRLDDNLKKYSKFIRVVIKATVFILLIGVIAFISFAFRGYWF